MQFDPLDSLVSNVRGTLNEKKYTRDPNHEIFIRTLLWKKRDRTVALFLVIYHLANSPWDSTRRHFRVLSLLVTDFALRKSLELFNFVSQCIPSALVDHSVKGIKIGCMEVVWKNRAANFCKTFEGNLRRLECYFFIQDLSV